MAIDPRAGQPAEARDLVDIGALLAAYAALRPDPAVAAQRVTFGTSGHRGSSLERSFNEAHVLAITQAICEHRRAAAVTGPLFLGIDTHALSEPAFRSALEVLAANAVDVLIAPDGEFTPIGGSGLLVARHQIQGGAHTMTGDKNFGIVVYGYGSSLAAT